MLYNYFRVFYYNGTTMTDYSDDNQEDGKTLATNLTANTHYIYMAQYAPFNNFFYYMDTANAVTPTSPKIEYWNGTTWITSVDVIDGTKVSSASLARSGVIQWSPNIEHSWQCIDDPSKNYAPAELQAMSSDMRPYNCYWLRLSYTSSLTAGSKAKKFTYSFTSTQQLNKLDVQIADFMPAFATGKTDWIPEIITASEMVVSDLRRLGLINNRGEILRFDDVSRATDWRTLMLIYSNLGKAYDQKRFDADKEYQLALKSGRFSVDQDGDGFLDKGETYNRIYTAVR